MSQGGMMNITPYSVPPGWQIEKWFDQVTAQDENYVQAVQNLVDTARSDFPDANWIVQFYAQQTDSMTYTSGVAVFATRIP
jgi:hypothetical protein